MNIRAKLISIFILAITLISSGCVANQKDCGATTYPSTPSAENTSTKKKVERNEELVKIQLALSEKGYEPGIADGIYGKNTRQALRQYQLENGLEATGEADSATKAQLLN